MLLGHFGRKSGSCSKLGCFTRWLNLFLFLYLKSSKLPLNLLCYTAVPVFFQKLPKPAQLNILSLGVTTISMRLTDTSLQPWPTRHYDKWYSNFYNYVKINIFNRLGTAGAPHAIRMQTEVNRATAAPIWPR